MGDVVECGKCSNDWALVHLQVNGNPVRYSTHTDVVKWIKGITIGHCPNEEEISTKASLIKITA